MSCLQPPQSEKWVWLWRQVVHVFIVIDSSVASVSLNPWQMLSLLFDLRDEVRVWVIITSQKSVQLSLAESWIPANIYWKLCRMEPVHMSWWPWPNFKVNSMPKETKGTELLILSFLFAMTVTSLDTWLFSCMENDRVAVMMRAAKAKKAKQFMLTLSRSVCKWDLLTLRKLCMVGFILLFRFQQGFAFKSASK